MRRPADRSNKARKPVQRRCERCRGSGRLACPVCGGKGQVQIGSTVMGGPIFDTCTGCFGVKTARCSRCNGTGFHV